MAGKLLALGEKEVSQKGVTSLYINKWYLALSWVVYFVLFYLTEICVNPDNAHVMHSVVDDIIPFNEYFIIFYFLWHVVLFVLLLYYLLRDEFHFKRMQLAILITQIICLSIYVLYPTVQYLRPDELSSGFFNDIVGWLYMFDTPTGICPSQHVTHSVIVGYYICTDERFGKPFKGFMSVVCIMIILSVLFVKQHSFIDVVCAIPLECLIIWFVERLFRYKYVR